MSVAADALVVCQDGDGVGGVPPAGGRSIEAGRGQVPLLQGLDAGGCLLSVALRRGGGTSGIASGRMAPPQPVGASMAKRQMRRPELCRGFSWDLYFLAGRREIPAQNALQRAPGLVYDRSLEPA